MRVGYRQVMGVAAAITAFAAVQSWGATSVGIEGSMHDLSTNSVWNTRKGVCSPCHSAHHTDTDQHAPLWNHTLTTGPFTPYANSKSSGGTMDADTSGGPGGVSLACLSCHDGTVAINSSLASGTGSYAAVYMDAAAVIGPDLHTTHPISFVYDAALATADGGLEDPTTYKIGDAKTRLTVSTAPVPTSWPVGATPMLGKTIDEAMLFKHKMECASCHDVHKMDGASPSSGIFARISGTDAQGRGSTLCRTCHVK